MSSARKRDFTRFGQSVYDHFGFRRIFVYDRRILNVTVISEFAVYPDVYKSCFERQIEEGFVGNEGAVFVIGTHKHAVHIKVKHTVLVSGAQINLVFPVERDGIIAFHRVSVYGVSYEQSLVDGCAAVVPDYPCVSAVVVGKHESGVGPFFDKRIGFYYVRFRKEGIAFAHKIEACRARAAAVARKFTRFVHVILFCRAQSLVHCGKIQYRFGRGSARADREHYGSA